RGRGVDVSAAPGRQQDEGPEEEQQEEENPRRHAFSLHHRRRIPRMTSISPVVSPSSPFRVPEEGAGNKEPASAIRRGCPLLVACNQGCARATVPPRDGRRLARGRADNGKWSLPISFAHPVIRSAGRPPYRLPSAVLAAAAGAAAIEGLPRWGH